MTVVLKWASEDAEEARDDDAEGLKMIEEGEGWWLMVARIEGGEEDEEKTMEQAGNEKY